MTSGVDSQQPRPAGPDLPTSNPTDLSALAPPSEPPVAEDLAALAPPTGVPVAVDTSPQAAEPATPVLVQGPDGLVARPSLRAAVSALRRIGLAMVGLAVILVIREGVEGIFIALIGGLVGSLAVAVVWLPMLLRTRVVLGAETVVSRTVLRTRRFARSDVGRVGMVPYGQRGDRYTTLVLVVQDRSDRTLARLGSYVWDPSVLEAVARELAPEIEVSSELLRPKALELAFPGSTRWFERHPFLSVLTGVGAIILVGVAIGLLA
jgi:hypothetical protein